MSPSLYVHLLGNFCLAYDDTIINAVNTTRLKSALTYLLLHHDAPQSRQRMAFLFWPDTSEEQARSNLRNLIYFLKRALPDSEEYLLVEPQTIQWNPKASFKLDVDDFTRLASKNSTQGDLQQAIDLYRGDLLPECYEDWIQPERERLRETYLYALERLVDKLETARDYEGVIPYARRLLQADPLQEKTYLLLMRLFAANGERSKALHIYHTGVSVLESELGVQPGPEIQATYRLLLKSEGQPAVQRLPGTPPLIGREHDWNLLRSAWRNTANGQSHFVLISGEAGIGKTRLAEEMIDWANRQGIAIARAQCFAAEGELSFAPITAWLRSRPLPTLEDLWLSELSRLLPDLLVEHPMLPPPAPLTENWQRLRFFKALSLAILKERTELILLIEDIHWSDRDTIEWITYVMQAHSEIAPQEKLFVIGTLRTDGLFDHPSLETLLVDLRHHERLTQIELGPLNELETIALAQAIIGDEVEPGLSASLYRETEGNPLFVVEMLQAGKTEGSNWPHETPPNIVPMQSRLPEKVRQIIETHLATLSPVARDLTDLAAVAGREFSYQILSLASHFDEETLMRGLDELWRRRIVRERNAEAYDFSHDKIRIVAYEQMSRSRRRFCHHKVAEALESLYSNDLRPISAQLAAHYEEAGLFDRAIRYYCLAAQAAQSLFANQQSIQLLRKGLQLVEGKASQGLLPGWVAQVQAQMLELLGDILVRIGSYDGARLNYQQCQALPGEMDTLWQARLQRKIGNGFREQVFYDQAIKAYQQAQELLSQSSKDNPTEWWWEWIELQLDQSLVYFYLSRLDDVLRLVECLEPVIEPYGTAPQRGRYYRRLVTIKFRRQRFIVDDDTIQLSRKALATIKESDDLVEVASAYFGLGLALMCHGDLDEAENQIQAAIEVTNQTGQNLLPVCFAYLAVIYRRRGNAKTALEFAHRVTQISSEKDNPIYFAMAKSIFAWEAWRQKYYVVAEDQANQALAIWQDLPDAFPFRWIALWPLVASAIAQEHLSEAMNAVQCLFGAHQQPPPPALAAILTAAIQASNTPPTNDARRLLHQAVETAKSLGYL